MTEFREDVRQLKESLLQDIETGREAIGAVPPGTEKVPQKELVEEYRLTRESPVLWRMKIAERELKLQRRGYKRASEYAELEVALYAREMEKLMAKEAENA